MPEGSRDRTQIISWVNSFSTRPPTDKCIEPRKE
jgi:hypothetical protein